ncbi:MAG: hypothetical protein ABJP70_13240 [Erythrobacter sp.]
MKKLILVAAIAGLSACGGAASDEQSAAEPVETAVEEVTAADGGPSTGTFTITNSKGEVSTEVLAADGTYTNTDADGTVGNGVWEQRSPTEFCTQASDEEEMKCFAESVDADGNWTSTDPEDGEVSTILRVDTEAEGTATEG